MQILLHLACQGQGQGQGQSQVKSSQVKSSQASTVKKVIKSVIMFYAERNLLVNKFQQLEWDTEEVFCYWYHTNTIHTL